MAHQTRLQPDPVKGIIRLTRWKEQTPLISLTLVGGLIAHSVHGMPLDWRLVAVAVANFLTVTFAFMINDIEDAQDDARHPVSARRNPMTNGMLDAVTAWQTCAVVVVAALVLYASTGVLVLFVGGLNLLLSFLYSWKPIRLKSSTVGLDVVSHTLMLGGLLPLAAYLAYSTVLDPAIIMMAAAMTLGSAYGQLYNQVRDYDADKAAGIVNVTIRIGKRAAFALMYAAAVLSIGLGVLAVRELVFPSWTPFAVIGGMLLGFVSTFVVQTDASGKPPLDITGRLQGGFWITFNVLIIVWVLWAMGVL
mgnify:CR=1 FL=1